MPAESAIEAQSTVNGFSVAGSKTMSTWQGVSVTGGLSSTMLPLDHWDSGGIVWLSNSAQETPKHAAPSVPHRAIRLKYLTN